MDRLERTRQAIDADPYAASQGFVRGDVTDEEVRVHLTVRDDQVDLLGGTHGGVLHSLADSAFSLASNA